jgi:imidazolonepropionase-like amidohydrolase/Zn-dependent protease
MESLKTSWRIGCLKGVDVRLHFSMVLILPLVFYLFSPEDRWGWLVLLIWLTGFFISVLLHQAGHALTARHFGIAVEQITLWPLGGLPDTSLAPAKPGRRFLIGASGPLVSLLCGLALWAFDQADLTPVSLWIYLDPVWAELIYVAVQDLVVLNGALLVVNLLPVSPLDGGEMFNAILEKCFGKRAPNATSTAVGFLAVSGVIVLGIVASDFVLSAAGLLLALGFATFDPLLRRWTLAGAPPRGPRPMPVARHRSRVALAGVGVFALLVLVGLGVLMFGGPGEAPVLMLEHANLIDGVSDTPQRDVTVVVTDGKISVVSVGSFSPPANAKRFDLKGRWLLPGFIDAHIHTWNTTWTKTQLTAAGMTTGRSMLNAHYLDIALRERHRRGDFDLPDILASGYPVVPNIGTFPIPEIVAIYLDQPHLKDLRQGTDIGVAGARRLARANLDRQVDLIKVFATNRAWFPESDPRGRALSNEQLAAAVAEARTAGIPVAAHAYGDDGAAAAVRAGANTIEHGVYLSDATLELMKERNVCFVPTMSVFPQPGPTAKSAVGADLLAARRQDLATSVRDSARRAHKMGVGVIAGTDNAGNIGNEVMELVGIGMTPMEAIQAATARSADVLGISKRTGSIRPGLEADLVVLDGNPLENVKAVTRVVLVVNDGRIVANRLPAK